MKEISTKKDKIILLIIGAVFFLIGLFLVVRLGSSYTMEIDTLGGSVDISQYRISLEQEGEREIIGIRGKHIEDGRLLIELFSVAPGRAFVEVNGPDDFSHLGVIYVHGTGVITRGSFFGYSTGAFVIPLLIALYILLILLFLTVHFLRSLKTSLYQYKNIRYLAWIIILVFSLIIQAGYLTTGGSIENTVSITMNSFTAVSFFIFPVAFVLSILVGLSSIILMKKEGRSIKNMLPLLLGIAILAATLIPSLVSTLLYNSEFVDLHNSSNPAAYIEMGLNNISYAILSYLECVLLATIILSVAAAKRTPPFNKDYILILGCRINKDGSLTPLLRGRADKALEFAKRQKEAAGRDIVFVPSGGKGSDEIMAEGEAIRDYLLSKGIEEDRIITEKTSKNTEENFRNSIELIKERDGGKDPAIAFSTTNYHVFRSGILSRQQGVDADGVGSRTKAYFWINAFVREFVATLFSGWKKHLLMVIVLALIMAAMAVFVMMSNIL